MIRRALARVAAMPGVHAADVSSFFESAPWGFTAQPAFINAVVRVQTSLGPVQLFLALGQIEKELGRTSTFRWGPREIDLDLLLYGDREIKRRGLIVPHPSMHERAFVLAPLRELYPEYRSPAGLTIDEVLASLQGEQSVKRLEGSVH